MIIPEFSDLSLIRRGGEHMRNGGGATTLEPVQHIDEWEEKALALKRIFTSFLGEKPALNFQLDISVNWEKDFPAYTLRHLSYNVDFDERINAYMLIPKNIPLPAPAMLCLHPTTPLGKEQSIGNDPSEKGQDRAYARELAEEGYISFAYDLLSANERCYPGLPAFETAPFYEKYPHWSVRGKDLHDVDMALEVMQNFSEINPNRIGSIGHSQGGGITMHAMAMNSKIKVGVSSCGGAPMRISKNPYNMARESWWVGMPLLRDYCLTGKQFPVQLHEILAMAAPRALLKITATNDYQYTMEEEPFMQNVFENMKENIKQIYKLYNRENAFGLILHNKGHGFEKPEREKAIKFLKKHL